MLKTPETEKLISTESELRKLVAEIEPVERIAIDTEADSLHCYREKLCLLQVSLPNGDFVVDPLALRDLQPLAAGLKEKEIVLHGADFDLRLLRSLREIDLKIVLHQGSEAELTKP